VSIRNELEALAERNHGTVAKVYNSVLCHGIIKTPRGFEIYNEYGYSGISPTLEQAVQKYDRGEVW